MAGVDRAPGRDVPGGGAPGREVPGDEVPGDEAALLIASVARPQGTTGVHTHVNQLRQYLERTDRPAELVTPHAWAGSVMWRRAVLLCVFGVGVVLGRVNGPMHVWWYRSSHEYFLRRALRSRLAGASGCTVYAQCPVSARAAMGARVGAHQRVVLAVHFRVSQADEWADKGRISREGLVYRRIRLLERRVVPRADALVFVSAWARSALTAWLPEAASVPGTVVHNFISVPAVRQRPVRPGHLVTVGSLEPVKNHRFLLHVLAAARDKGRTYTLDVFGEGDERGRLLQLADELGVRDQVRLQGFCRDVQQRLPGHAAYVHASYSESSSLAIMEAMAVGLPVVSSDLNALGELFDDPAHGRFWPIDDAEEAARILIDLLDGEEERHRAGKAARQKFLSSYDADVVAPRLLRLLRGEPVADTAPA